MVDVLKKLPPDLHIENRELNDKSTYNPPHLMEYLERTPIPYRGTSEYEHPFCWE
jgi:hypothetical protein